MAKGVTRDPSEMKTVFGVRLPSWRRIWLWGAICVALFMPFYHQDVDVGGGYAMFFLTRGLILAIAVSGLNLLTGFNGQFSLGHSAFFALGAYTAAALIFHWDVTYYWTLIPSLLMCFVAGFLFGLPALRLEGLYLALATFALAIAMPQLLKYEHVEGLTGGVQGLFIERPAPPFGLHFDYTDHYLYLFVLGVLMLVLWVVRNLVKGRFGRAIMAIRDNPLAAKSMGVNAPLYKSGVFGTSAALTGLAGALEAVVVAFVAPDSFTFLLSITLLVGMVIGGIGSIGGAVFGGLFVLVLPNWAEALAEQLGRPDAKGLSWAVYGIFLILAVYVMPRGAASVAKRSVGWATRALPGAGDWRRAPGAIWEEARGAMRRLWLRVKLRIVGEK